jgi:protein involved in polysaccharide export with SLBB domain
MKTPVYIQTLAAISIACLLAAGCSSFKNRAVVLTERQSPEDSPAKASLYSLQDQYYLAPGDVIEIQFPYSKENNDTYTITPDGYASLVMIGPVKIAGKTPGQLQEEISGLYASISYDGSHPDEKKEYRIATSDVLEIKFANHAELNEKVVVLPDGKISLPLIGSIVAEGKSPEMLGKELNDKYRSQINQVRLVVIVREFTSNKYYLDGKPVAPLFKGLEKPLIMVRQASPMQFFVGGEVTRPSLFPYTGPITAMQAIIMAGGPTKFGETRNVAIVRKTPDRKTEIIWRNITEKKLEQSAPWDIQLKPYDMVIVPKSTIGKVNDFLDKYIYSVVPFLRNSSLSFIYSLDEVDYNITPTPTP